MLGLMMPPSRGFICCIAACSLVLGSVPVIADWVPKEELRAQVELRAQAELLEAFEAQLRELPAEGETLARFGELEGMLRKMKELTGQDLLLREDVRGIEREIRGYAGANYTYRPRYFKWVRMAAVGEMYPELITVSGKSYRDVVVRRVTDVGLEIHHAEGSARLRHATLPAEFQKRFQWDSRAAQIMLKREAELEWLATRLAAAPPFVSRLDSSEPIVTTSLDSSAPIETRSLDSSGPIVTKSLDSPASIVPLKLHSSGKVGEYR
jgi:hypothetical protein